MEEDTRLATEIELLEAMYPAQISFDQRSRDVKFVAEFAALHLRLPPSYPSAGLPEVLSASDGAKRDIRNKIKAEIQALGLAEGEEALDAIIASFQNYLETNQNSDSNGALDTKSTQGTSQSNSLREKTVIIWLHHLLNTNKRKLALSPTDTMVNGITKPGYPGIMVFSGPASGVDEHVKILKSERWQAFQVRLEEEGSWAFGRGKGVKEVETMGEVVKLVEDGDQGKRGTKEVFLKAVGIV